MKKMTFVFSLILSCLFIFSTIGIINVSATGLDVTFTANPTIAAPGTNGYIEVNLKNSGGSASNIDITATSLDPNALILQGNWENQISSLDSGDSQSLIYEFKVRNTATPGLYQVVFEVTYSGGSKTQQTAVIKVEDATVLDLTSVTPTSIRIGEATTLVFNISNNGGANIENILFTWDDPNKLILPLGSDNRLMIPSISAKNHTELPIVVMASSGISPGIYPLTITLNFYDHTGTQQTVTSTVGLQISGTTTFDIVPQQSTAGSTTFAVVNTGANVASSVIVSIPPQLAYIASGVSSASLGNLNAGDYTLASFQISSTSSNTTTSFPLFNRTGMNGAPVNRNFTGGRNTFTNRSFSGLGGNRLLVQIAYTDIFGIRQTIQQQVNLSSGSASGFSTRTGTQSSTGSVSRGFSSQSQSSGSSNGVVYIIIGVVGIIVIVAVIQLGRKKKLPHFGKLFKRRKE